MRGPIAHLACLTLVMTSVSLAASVARAAWVPHGNPVCVAPGDQKGGIWTSDGSGGVFVVWVDGRRGFPLTDLYATRLLADGSTAPGWPANGAALAATGHVTAPSIASDGSGGLMAFWFDQTDYKPRMQHVNASGALAPGFPANGLTLPIVVGGPTGYVFRAGGDGTGGAYILWNNFNGTADAALVTRVTGTGAFAAGWSASGVAQAYSDSFNPFTGFSGLSLQVDPTGGTLVGATYTVEDFPSGSHSVGLWSRTLANGSWAYSAGAPHPPSVGGLSLAPDGGGGAFAAWTASVEPTRRMQHVLANGSATWPEPTAAPVTDAMVPDGSGGLYLFGLLGGPERLELHRRAADASIPAPWTPAGIVLSTSGPHYARAICRSGALLYACWSNGPYPTVDLRAIAVTADGNVAPGWNAGGTTVCSATAPQNLTGFGPFSADEAVAVWEDWRAGDSDIYATLFEPGGPVTLDAPGERPNESPTLAFAASPTPNPARDRVVFSLRLADGSSAWLEIVDAAGRVHGSFAIDARRGVQSLPFDVAHLPAGVYWAHLRQGRHEAVRRFAVLH